MDILKMADIDFDTVFSSFYVNKYLKLQLLLVFYYWTIVNSFHTLSSAP